MRTRRSIAVFVAAALSILAACAPPRVLPPELVLTAASFEDLPGWNVDRQSAALAAFRRSCPALAAPSLPGPDSIAGTADDWRAPCGEAESLAAGDDVAARAFIMRWFLPFLVTDRGGDLGLFTGYFEPELRGARARDERFSVPIYRRPADLVTVELGQFRDEWRGQRIAGRIESGSLRPYASRAEIEAGALAGERLEILWVDDPIDAFFLHIQGSGRVVLADGSVIRLGYAAQNGQPYVPIGRELIARGALSREESSMQSIRAWLASYPAEAAAVMNANPSYIFFRVLDGDGPVGSLGVTLTPGRSLAVDRAFLPLGVPLWLDVEDPLDSGQRVQRLVVAQDTGGAILGVVRGDRKSTRLNSSHIQKSRMPSSA